MTADPHFTIGLIRGVLDSINAATVSTDFAVKLIGEILAGYDEARDAELVDMVERFKAPRAAA